MKLLNLIYLIVILSCQLYSQDLFHNELFAIHPRAGYNLNFHSGNFNGVNGMYSCGMYSSGFGAGPSFSLSFEKNSGASFFSLGFGYEDKSGKLKVGSSYPTRDTLTGNIRNVETENEMDAVLGYVSIKADFRHILAENFITGPLRAFAGLAFDIPMKTTYTQTQRIVNPSNATFTYNGLSVRERQLASGDIAPRTGMITGLYIGLENMLKVGKEDYLTQQISYNFAFSNIATGVDWKVNTLKLELGYRFSISKPVEKPTDTIEPEVKADTVPVIAQSKILVDTIETTTESTKTTTITKTTEVKKKTKVKYGVTIEKVSHKLYTGNEILATLPIVDAVFFERESAVIPEFYLQQYDSLPDFYHGDAVAAHKWVIPRIVEILKSNPKARLTIEGATSGPKNEPEGLDLALKRAEVVRDVILKLGIPKSQITLGKRIYPLYQSNQDHDKGQIENQRADLFVENAPLQKYVSLQRFKQLEGIAEFTVYSNGIPEDSVLWFRSNVLGKEIPVQHNTKLQYDFKHRVDDDWKSYFTTADVHYSGEPADFTLPKETWINHKDTIMIDLIVENFNAVLRFDYNSSRLNEDNKGLLRDLIDVLPLGITIIVAGSADALGPDERNVVLTKERADVTIAYLNKISGGKYNIEKSTEFGKFPEDTQQGRFLDRSIRIRLRR